MACRNPSPQVNCAKNPPKPQKPTHKIKKNPPQTDTKQHPLSIPTIIRLLCNGLSKHKIGKYNYYINERLLALLKNISYRE